MAATARFHRRPLGLIQPKDMVSLPLPHFTIECTILFHHLRPFGTEWPWGPYDGWRDLKRRTWPGRWLLCVGDEPLNWTISMNDDSTTLDNKFTYKARNLLASLGWVNFDLRCSTLCLVHFLQEEIDVWHYVCPSFIFDSVPFSRYLRQHGLPITRN